MTLATHLSPSRKQTPFKPINRTQSPRDPIAALTRNAGANVSIETIGTQGTVELIDLSKLINEPVDRSASTVQIDSV